MNEPEGQPSVRQAARVLVLDPDSRVLLLRIQEPSADKRAFWITPGGGLEAGETHKQAALRELREETGLSGVALGPCVWHRRNEFDWLGDRLCQIEQFYFLQTEAFTPSSAEHTDIEAQVLTDFRWWSVDEIAAETNELFAPRTLARHLKALLDQGIPDEPINVGA